MTIKEKLTLERVDQKVDDLVLRFDKLIANMKWVVGTAIAFLTFLSIFFRGHP